MTNNTELTLEKLVAFCKRKGFVFASSEIYGGFGAIYDYGHYGILLKDNIKKAWWKNMVQKRLDVVGLDSGIFMHPMTWKASGHVDGFNDPQIDCKDCKSRYRADHIIEENIDIDADKMPLEDINNYLHQFKEEGKLKCKKCGGDNFTDAKVFSLMVKSNLGSPTDTLSEENVVYLRPETCGGIYLEYKNTQESTRKKLPFGIAQVGKAFRNEIVARQFVFRTREFEQMEMQYFLHPNDMKTKFEFWHQERWKWYIDYGIKEENLNWHKHTKLAHYASDAYDIEYKFRCLKGFKEVEGIHARGNWDLSQHSKFSGTNLEYFDESTKEKFIPHIMETSVGLARLFMMFLDQSYTEEDIENENGEKETRIVFKIDKRLAPIQIGILPLMKKDGLAEKAQELFGLLSEKYMCEYDETGSVGKRYRRQDEIGTPYCITIDYDTIGKGEAGLNKTVTIRDRDSMKQERVKIGDLIEWFDRKL